MNPYIHISLCSGLLSWGCVRLYESKAWCLWMKCSILHRDVLEETTDKTAIKMALLLLAVTILFLALLSAAGQRCRGLLPHLGNLPGPPAALRSHSQQEPAHPHRHQGCGPAAHFHSRYYWLPFLLLLSKLILTEQSLFKFLNFHWLTKVEILCICVCWHNLVQFASELVWSFYGLIFLVI